MKRLLLTVAPLALTLAVAGCGGSSSSSSSGSSAAAGAAAASSSAPSSSSAARGAYGAASSGAASSGAASGAAAPAAGASGPATVSTKTTKLGTILVDAKGMTLYLWVADTATKSVCSGQCAKFWPPLLTKGAPTASGGTQAGQLGTSARDDGTTQVTYAGHPLYTFLEDKAPGDDLGQGSDGFGAKWWVLAPDGKAISSTTAAAPASSAAAGASASGPAVVSTKTTKLGPILAGAKGMTLYLWVADKGTKSVCTGECAAFWPPLLTKGAPTASGAAKAAELGTSTRPDGSTQVTYNGHPLYYFAKDKDREDHYGQGSNGAGAKWWIVGPDGKAITG